MGSMLHLGGIEKKIDPVKNVYQQKHHGKMKAASAVLTILATKCQLAYTNVVASTLCQYTSGMKNVLYFTYTCLFFILA